MRALQFLASFLAIVANLDGFVQGLDPRVINVSAADLVSHLQPVVRAASVRHNVSFSVGVRTAFSGPVSVTYGFNDRSTSTPMTTSDRLPMGSVTKSWTATAVLRLHERGLMDMDAPISRYVDPILKRLNGTTMLELWNNDARILNVTARMLMGMRGGLHDYDDAAYRDFVFNNAGGKGFWTPFDMIHALDKSWVCVPGSCGEYSSVGFDILGLALAQVYNCSSWKDLDQMSVSLPPSLVPKYRGRVGFPMEEACSAEEDIVHQYSYVVDGNESEGFHLHFPDLRPLSCLNGWTCGNIAATVGSIADWYFDLFTPGVVLTNESLTAMLNDVPLDHGWHPGLRYGLGVSNMHLSWCDRRNLTWTIGHGGGDYGTTAHIAGYNTRFGFSIIVATNAAGPMNCSEGYKKEHPVSAGMLYGDESFYYESVCVAYDAVLQAVTNSSVARLNCTRGKATSQGGDYLSNRHKPKPTTNYTCSWNF